MSDWVLTQNKNTLFNQVTGTYYLAGFNDLVYFYVSTEANAYILVFNPDEAKNEGWTAEQWLLRRARQLDAYFVEE